MLISKNEKMLMPRKPFQTDFLIYKKCYQLGYREILKIVWNFDKFR